MNNTYRENTSGEIAMEESLIIDNLRYIKVQDKERPTYKSEVKDNYGYYVTLIFTTNEEESLKSRQSVYRFFEKEIF